MHGCLYGLAVTLVLAPGTFMVYMWAVAVSQHGTFMVLIWVTLAKRLYGHFIVLICLGNTYAPALQHYGLLWIMLFGCYCSLRPCAGAAVTFLELRRFVRVDLTRSTPTRALAVDSG
jgi:hypothetical protein